MTKLQLAKLRQRVRTLKARRTALEYVALAPHTMLAASLLERQFRPGGPVAYYLSIPHPVGSRHRYVRKANVEPIRRQTTAWREFCHAMAERVLVDNQIESLLRQIGRGRCQEIKL